MTLFEDIGKFLLPAGFGVAVSIALSDDRSLTSSATRIFVGFFCAIFFTQPLLHYFSLDPEIYAAPVTALLALTGDRLARWVLKVATNPLEIFKHWGSKK